MTARECRWVLGSTLAAALLVVWGCGGRVAESVGAADGGGDGNADRDAAAGEGSTGGSGGAAGASGSAGGVACGNTTCGPTEFCLETCGSGIYSPLCCAGMVDPVSCPEGHKLYSKCLCWAVGGPDAGQPEAGGCSVVAFAYACTPLPAGPAEYDCSAYGWGSVPIIGGRASCCHD